jgi:hypothetical protein
MPTDLHDGIDDWFVPGATPGGADYPDDWYVPTAARADTSYPDDWYVPTPAASPVTAQSVPDAQLAAANPSIRNQATPRPDPFAAYWSLIPASRAGATAWHPPIFPNSLGRFPLTAPAPASAPPIDATGSLLGGVANLQATNIDQGHGLLGAIADLPWANPAASPSSQRTGFAPGSGNQSAPPSLFSSLANRPWSPPSAISDATSDTGNYPVGSNRTEPFPLPDHALFGRTPLDTSSSLTPPALNWQPASLAALPFPQRSGLTSGDSGQSTPPSPVQNRSELDSPVPSSGSGGVEGDSAGGHVATPSTNSNESSSITRVVRDTTGRALAIIHVQQEPSAASPSEGENDSTPDALRSGAKYAQINNAVTGYPVIDRTTDMLLAVLKQSIVAMGSGSGALFGIRVHTDFAKRVKQLDLPGIGQDGVEQSFHLDFTDFVKYGMDGSIRTDIALRDPKNPSQGPIAVYDLKTGNAVLTPSRVEEIRNALKQKYLPVIMLHYRTGDALSSPGRAPPP